MIAAGVAVLAGVGDVQLAPAMAAAQQTGQQRLATANGAATRSDLCRCVVGDQPLVPFKVAQLEISIMVIR